MRHFIYTCDWEIVGGETWDKAFIARYRDIENFTALRRRTRPPLAPPEMGPMGWHLSFFGGPDQIIAKVDSNCHPESREEFRELAVTGRAVQRGVIPFHPHQATPVNADDTWPRYVTQGRAPASWFRPR
jgi:hypothetical protein